MATLEFVFDFASPNAYYVHKVLPDLIDRTGAELVILPTLLGGLFKITGNQAPFITFSDVKGKMAYEMLENERFQAKHQLNDFVFNSHFPINTVMIMRGLVAARELNVQAQYIDVVMSAMWEQDMNMGDPDTVLRVWQEGGLDANELGKLIQTDSIKDALKHSTQAVADRGAFGIPTFFVGEDMFFGKERLNQVEDALSSAQG